MPQSKNRLDDATHCPSRRTFLAVAAGAALAAAVATPLSFMPRAFAASGASGTSGAPGASADLSAAFLRLSMFVTGQRDLDPQTGARFFTSLSRHDPAFGAHIGTLLAHIDDAKFADMDAFVAATPVDTPLFATASQIVSAWYLGIVGNAADAELITYADSLMYRPTRGILAVPTYGPGPLAWGPKPV